MFLGLFYRKTIPTTILVKNIHCFQITILLVKMWLLVFSKLADSSITALWLNFQLNEDFNKVGFFSCLSTVSTFASQEEALNNLKMQSLSEHQYKKANLPFKTRQEIFSSSQDTSPYIHEIVEFQKKNTNKIKTLSNLFWGNHPQRKCRGYWEKCCLKGCTKRTYYCMPSIYWL